MLHVVFMQVFQQSKASSENEKPHCGCCPASPLSTVCVRWASPSLGHSASALPLPHLNHLVPCLGYSLSSLHAGASRAGLLGSQAHTDWHIWLHILKVGERVDSDLYPSSSTAKPSQDHTID